MEYLTEERLKFLLHKEWLVRADNIKSIPYLIKFYPSTVDQCCYLMITDTKEVWGEVLTSKQFARRWRDCNPALAPPLTISDEEDDEWRSELLDLLSNVHSLGGITDTVFEVVDSRNADFAFELGSNEFKWRWETYSLGPKVSADILSKHLIMPLISVTHLSFSSADPVGKISEGDLEKAVDKVGRTARRTVDTHVKHSISRPRVATTLRRMTAMFNFLPELPPITSEIPTPELIPPIIEQKHRVKTSHHAANATPPSCSAITINNDAPEEQSPRPKAHDISIDVPRRKAAPAEDSETEKSSDDAQAAPKQNKQETSSSPPPPSRKDSAQESPGSRDRAQIARSSQKPASKSSHAAAADTSSAAEPPSSPARPAKKAKRAQVSSSSDDEDSEAERKRHLSQMKGSSTRGAKQPLKRGGRRF